MQAGRSDTRGAGGRAAKPLPCLPASALCCPDCALPPGSPASGDWAGAQPHTAAPHLLADKAQSPALLRLSTQAMRVLVVYLQVPG